MPNIEKAAGRLGGSMQDYGWIGRRELMRLLGVGGATLAAGLPSRIHAAAVRLCRSEPYSEALQGWASSVAASDSDCIAHAVERANAQIANARVN